MCSHLLKTSVIIKMNQLTFHMLTCAFIRRSLHFFSKSFLFLFLFCYFPLQHDNLLTKYPNNALGSDLSLTFVKTHKAKEAYVSFFLLLMDFANSARFWGIFSPSQQVVVCAFSSPLKALLQGHYVISWNLLLCFSLSFHSIVFQIIRHRSAIYFTIIILGCK